MRPRKQLEFSIKHLTQLDHDLLTIYCACDDPQPPFNVEARTDRLIVSVPDALSDEESYGILVTGLIRARHSDTFIDILELAGREGADTVAFVNKFPLDSRFPAQYDSGSQ